MRPHIEVWRLSVLALLASVGACSPVPPSKYTTTAVAYLALVRSGDTAKATTAFVGADTIPTFPSLISEAGRFLRKYDPASADLIGWRMFLGPTGTVDLTYELHGDSGWALIAIHLVTRGDSAAVAGFHWQPSAQSTRAANAFTLRGKGAGNYVFLLLGFVALGVSIAGIILAIRMRLRWWWVAFAAIGLGRATLVWSSGDLSFTPFSILFFSVGAFRYGGGPWTVALSLPFGAWYVIGKAVRQWEARNASRTAA